MCMPRRRRRRSQVRVSPQPALQRMEKATPLTLPPMSPGSTLVEKKLWDPAYNGASYSPGVDDKLPPYGAGPGHTSRYDLPLWRSSKSLEKPPGAQGKLPDVMESAPKSTGTGMGQEKEAERPAAQERPSSAAETGGDGRRRGLLSTFLRLASLRRRADASRRGTSKVTSTMVESPRDDEGAEK